jgi:hypothetical protein
MCLDKNSPVADPYGQKIVVFLIDVLDIQHGKKARRRLFSGLLVCLKQTKLIAVNDQAHR